MNERNYFGEHIKNSVLYHNFPVKREISCFIKVSLLCEHDLYIYIGRSNKLNNVTWHTAGCLQSPLCQIVRSSVCCMNSMSPVDGFLQKDLKKIDNCVKNILI